MANAWIFGKSPTCRIGELGGLDPACGPYFGELWARLKEPRRKPVVEFLQEMIMTSASILHPLALEEVPLIVERCYINVWIHLYEYNTMRKYLSQDQCCFFIRKVLSIDEFRKYLNVLWSSEYSLSLCTWVSAKRFPLTCFHLGMFINRSTISVFT